MVFDGLEFYTYCAIALLHQKNESRGNVHRYSQSTSTYNSQAWLTWLVPIHQKLSPCCVTTSMSSTGARNLVALGCGVASTSLLMVLYWWSWWSPSVEDVKSGWRMQMPGFHCVPLSEPIVGQSTALRKVLIEDNTILWKKQKYQFTSLDLSSSFHVMRSDEIFCQTKLTEWC